MTNREILIKAIKKITSEGYIRPDQRDEDTIPYSSIEEFADAILENDDDMTKNMIRSVVFDHEFAKPFWGEAREIRTHGGLYDVSDCENLIGERLEYAWQYHLQQMVLEEEPLKYLERFL